MNTLIITLIVLSTLIFLITVIQYDLYSAVIPNRILNKELDIHIPNGCELKASETFLNDDIYLYIGEMPFITNIEIPIFFKYYVNNVGMVFRFSSAHKRIAKIHRELIREKFNVL
jgi:hypothetical protein